MEDDFIDALLAVRPRLTGGELSVALARYRGHVTYFDIQRITGLKKERVEAANTALWTKCPVYVVNILNIYNIYNNTTLKGSGQNVQKTPSPPQSVLSYLLRKIGRSLPPHAADYKGFGKAYPIAYKFAKRDHRQALQLIKDVIDLHLDQFRKANYPGSWLPRITDAYLNSIPEMPSHVYERMLAKNLSFRYNDGTKQWEERE